MKINIKSRESFRSRHIGPDKQDIQHMLNEIGVDDLDQLIDETIPSAIRSDKKLDLPGPIDEKSFIDEIKKLVNKNEVFRSFIGMGYYNTITPAVIQRNVLENPGWYTAYTPYQAEIAQGRLEALINFQTMVSDLTAMGLANASLLDEGTAAAEAMSMALALRSRDRKNANVFLVDENIFPQTLDVLRSRSAPIDIELRITRINEKELNDPDIFGMILQYPDGNGAITDYSELVKSAREKDILSVFIADLLSLTILTPPGEYGVDAVVGTTQRFGVPPGFGGPHAAYFATREEYRRHIPGRIIGVSKDADDQPAFRMALQTREQHIRREKATSNICTAQVLLAVMAGMYGVYHGPEGLKNIAKRIYGMAVLLDRAVKKLGYEQENTYYFDTLKIRLEPGEKEEIKKLSVKQRINFRYFETSHIGISTDETTRLQDIKDIYRILAGARGQDTADGLVDELAEDIFLDWPEELVRQSGYLTHPTFNSFHSEHEMLRYLKRLENKDLSLVHSMIPLGSCTMKLNATTEMIPITWPELAALHPYAPLDQARGYLDLIRELENWLSEITGFAATSVQPNSGAQGEFSGLMVIRAYHESRGEKHRNVTLIPSSAHGTNPASAVMAGMDVVIVKCDDRGNIDIDDLKEKAGNYSENLSALMVTYPSTHGVFEEGIREVCDIIHRHGGQVYMDGANMNAQVGLTNPAIIGADVCHLNLHKTFCIPHGGGGPGVGPICVAEHLKPFLPGNPIIQTGGENSITAISAAPWGSAGILAISYAYIRLMGAEGLTQATRIAILNTNYIKSRLEKNYKILYSGTKGRCAHEMIVDCREFRKHNIEVEDIAKRLMDYGFHAPTVSFPVPGTLMIEPTESESLAELDRFCDSLLKIREEIEEVISGKSEKENNILKNSPHSMKRALNDEWTFPYSREKAVYPLPFVKENKFWPGVSRIDSAYGDRNLFCSCVPVSDHSEPETVEME